MVKKKRATLGKGKLARDRWLVGQVTASRPRLYQLALKRCHAFRSTGGNNTRRPSTMHVQARGFLRVLSSAGWDSFPCRRGKSEAPGIHIHHLWRGECYKWKSWRVKQAQRRCR